MLEILVLAIAIIVLPFLPGQLFWSVLLLLIVLPGTYAMRHGPPFVPTPRKTLECMMEFAGIKKGDRVYDLGCGDGRLVFAAAKRGARAVGYELSIPMFLIAKIRSLFRKNTSIRYGNFWKRDYADADVIVCYLLTDAMQTFHRTIWPQLPKGCRVVSHAFRMKDVKAVKDEKGVIMYVKD